MPFLFSWLDLFSLLVAWFIGLLLTSLGLLLRLLFKFNILLTLFEFGIEFANKFELLLFVDP
jgi:hypothetical protein